jgi:hypothetical protein
MLSFKNLKSTLRTLKLKGLKSPLVSQDSASARKSALNWVIAALLKGPFKSLPLSIALCVALLLNYQTVLLLTPDITFWQYLSDTAQLLLN